MTGVHAHPWEGSTLLPLGHVMESAEKGILPNEVAKNWEKIGKPEEIKKTWEELLRLLED